MTEKLPKPATVELDDDMCIEVQAQHIHAAGVFVSKDTRSVLTAVCIRREGDAIKIQATDNFKLISIESRAEEDGPDEIILLPYKAVKAALPKKGPVTLCLNHQSMNQSMMLSITSCNGSSITIKAIEGIYPDVEQLFKLPGKGTIDGMAQFGINAKLVADAGKACVLALGSKGQDLRFTCTGGLKPILFTNLRPDDTARGRGLIMPLRI